MLQLFNPWFLVAALVPLVAALQWWLMRTLHLRRLAAVRARHQSLQQSAAKLLQQAREQTVQVQQELEAARQAARLRATTQAPRAVVSVTARERLNKMLDEAPQTRRALPADGFADTLPSLQFAPSTSFGLLQRSSCR